MGRKETANSSQKEIYQPGMSGNLFADLRLNMHRKRGRPRLPVLLGVRTGEYAYRGSSAFTGTLPNAETKRPVDVRNSNATTRKQTGQFFVSGERF